jgi:tetratricopeptide (TPR) repeat protein
MPRRLSALALAFGILAASVHAQTFGDYPGLVRAYIGGRGSEAVAALLRWPHGESIAAAKTAALTLTPREIAAAAILHTEIALSVVDDRPFDAAAHVEAAQTLLQAAQRDAAQRERTNQIAQRWYYFVASVFVSAKQMQPAAWYIREGLLAFPGSATLYFVRGTIAERSVEASWNRGLRSELPDNMRDRIRIEEGLKRAVGDYQHALNIDPHLTLAHLRVGWVRLYLGDKSARRELEAAAADAATDRTRYLAQLFLGGLAEREKRIDDARTAYQAALAAGGSFQTAYLALSRLEEAAGNGQRAQDLATQCAQLRKDDPDPWWDFASAFDRDMLLELRAAVRQP